VYLIHSTNKNFRFKFYSFKKNSMKTLNAYIFSILTIISHWALAASEASYYRVWQGFIKQGLSNNNFQTQLPAFMKIGPALYGDALNGYFVAMPPYIKPHFLPDEFALLALKDEATYRTIRATPEGIAYGDAHWTIFDKEKSKSLPLEMNIPSSLVSKTAYDLMGTSNDWGSGFTTFFIGLKKHDQTPEQFLKSLSDHVKLVSDSFKSMGLKGYIIIADEQYEVAYMNWASAEAMNLAFSSSAGKAVADDESRVFNTIQWMTDSPFDGVSVAPNSFYKAK
jgi:hypothetical protein